jgi:hypothetical protein
MNLLPAPPKVQVLTPPPFTPPLSGIYVAKLFYNGFNKDFARK